MAKIEQIARQAIGTMSHEMGSRQAQDFLREQFPNLSLRDARVLTRPDPLKKVIEDVRTESVGMKRAQLKRLVQQKFPLVSDPRRGQIVKVFALPIPPDDPDPQDPPIYEVIEQAIYETT